MKKAVCFPHSDDQFETPAELMEWLDSDLRILHDGYYRYRQAPGLGSLEPGSVVFFYKNGLIVGSAVTEKPSRALNDEEIKLCELVHDPENCADMVNIVKFFTGSIWVFNEHELIDKDEFKSITNKDLTHYVTINPDEIMDLYAVVARKKAETYGRN